ncbi:hypothetical protein M8J76_012043 [Diaphorina citri]|nr:hypothetical protein M8J75_006236 [Diaphorina citri]KAI5749998.1 hypothetical protein M8J76_012043 [Diaphorina citri]
MAFFKSIFPKGFRRKHEKLESRSLCHDEEEHEFQVRYLGERPISESNSKKSTAQAVSHLVQTAKHDKEKSKKVTLVINASAIRINETSSYCLIDIPLGHVSYCSADAKFSDVFAFVSVSATGDLKCLAFLCESKKQAREIATTMNKIFQTLLVSMKINGSF